MPRFGDIYGVAARRVRADAPTLAERVRAELRAARAAGLSAVAGGDDDDVARARLFPRGKGFKEPIVKDFGGHGVIPGADDDDDGAPRRVPPLEFDPMRYPPRVILLFSRPPFRAYRDGMRDFLDPAVAAAFARLDRLTEGGIDLRRIFTSLPDADRRRVLGEVSDRAYAVHLRRGLDPSEVHRTLDQMLVTDRREVGEAPLLTWAYVEPLPAPPPSLPSDPFLGDQTALTDPFPSSIGLSRAWDAGVMGDGVRFVDVEQGWLLCHDDLPKAADGTPAITPLWGVNAAYGHHGAAVLGLLAATHETRQGAGVAPRAEGRVASVWSVAEGAIFDQGQGWGVPAFGEPDDLLPWIGSTLIHSPADAILAALHWLRAGDVLVIEHQVGDFVSYRGREVFTLLPASADPLTRLMLRAAYALNVVVIEAAGNGGYDLGGYRDPNGHAVFSDPRYHTGSIMVGAGKDVGDHERYDSATAGSNYGHRVDNYAWGLHVATLGDPTAPYSLDGWNTDFRATSAATALVACAAVALQGARKQAGKDPYTPDKMRDALRHGVPSGDAALYPIGVMPDLDVALAAALSAGAAGAPTPNLWMRDHVTDTGVPFDVLPNAARRSPDLHIIEIATGARVADGDPVERSANPAYSVVAHVRNRGATAHDVPLDLYLVAQIPDAFTGPKTSDALHLTTVNLGQVDQGGATPTPAQPFRTDLGANFSVLWVVAVVRGPDDQAGQPPAAGTPELAFLNWVTAHENVAVQDILLA